MRNSKMTRTLFLPVLLLLILISNESRLYAEGPPKNIPCSSIASFDLQNTTIHNIKLVNGKACTSDSAEMPDRCDWEHTISRDEILKPIPGKEVRIVILHSNHETGSGAWETVLVFDCVNGFIGKLFEKKDLAGVKIEKKTNGEVILTSGVWQPKDPMCCPSKEKREIYRWSSKKNTYIIESITITSKSNLKH